MSIRLNLDIYCDGPEALGNIMGIAMGSSNPDTCVSCETIHGARSIKDAYLQLETDGWLILGNMHDHASGTNPDCLTICPACKQIRDRFKIKLATPQEIDSWWGVVVNPK